MNVDIICVGKIKEGYLRDAIGEYSKRLSKYCKLSIIEVTDEKTPDKSSQLQDDKIKQVEGERILKYIKQDAFKIALEIDGKQLSSEELANKLANVAVNGYSNIQFIIGGSLGLASNVCKIADMHLSFSKMTFPHQLMRVILLEQIYRTYRINNNEPYHK